MRCIATWAAAGFEDVSETLGFLDIAKTNFSGDLPSLYAHEDGRFFSDVARQAGLGTQQLLGWASRFWISTRTAGRTW